MIEWKDEYVLGIEEIDKQHQQLFKIAGDIHELIKNDIILDKYDRIMHLIGDLKEYTVFHFSSEEEYMKSIGYRKFFSHKVEHDDFIDKINHVDMEQMDMDHEQYLLDIMDFILNWISQHILDTDKAYTIK